MKVIDVAGCEPPHGNTIVWRYLSLEKFIDMIIYSRLHFTNQARLSDQREATIPDQNLAAQEHLLEDRGLSGRELEEAMADYVIPWGMLRGGTQLSCWSVMRHESYALWRIYLSESRSGVAIRSTVSRLRKAIEHGSDPYPDTVHMGTVKYQSYIEGDLNRFSIVLTKSPYYEFEKELRLCILEFPASEGGERRPYKVSVGRTVGVDVDLLVQEVYLSPFAGEWFEGSFRKMVSHLYPALESRIVRSAIRDT